MIRFKITISRWIFGETKSLFAGASARKQLFCSRKLSGLVVRRLVRFANPDNSGQVVLFCAWVWCFPLCAHRGQSARGKINFIKYAVSCRKSWVLFFKVFNSIKEDVSITFKRGLKQINLFANEQYMKSRRLRSDKLSVKNKV